MIGAIVRQEMVLGSRRNRMYLFRWIYASWLIVQLFSIWIAFLFEEKSQIQKASLSRDMLTYNELSAPHVVGEQFARTFLKQQALLLILATPPLVAGAIADEKTTGTLQYLLTTQLDTRHIILGKMIGRAAQVVLLSMVGLPLFGLMAGFGGVSPGLVLISFGALVVPLIGVAAASVLASVLCRHTRDAVLALYSGGLVVWIMLYVTGLVRPNDPFYVLQILEPAWGQHGGDGLREALGRLAISAACWTTLGLVCLGLAMARLRPVYKAQLEGRGLTQVTWYQVERPAVQDDPVRWRERHVEGLAPTRALRHIPQWLAITAVTATTTLSSLLILYASLPPGVGVATLLRAALRFNLIRVKAMLPGAEVGFLVQSLVVLLLASMIVGIRSSGAMTGERERKSWEALLLTPLSAAEIVQGKFWGILTSSYWYLLAYAAPALALSTLGGLQALFWTVLFLAVTVLAMYYLGAAGLWCSVRSSNSWRGLLSTVGFGYLGGAVIFAVISPIPFILAWVVIGILTLVDKVLNTQMSGMKAGTLTSYWSFFIVSAGLGMALVFYLMSRFFFLARTQAYIADRERTRHWQDEPYYRRPRRPDYDRPAYDRPYRRP